MRYLVIGHAHPDFSVGGAEIAAHNLYQSLRDDAETKEAIFLARTDMKSISPGSIVIRRGGEYLWRQDMGDWFKLRTAYPTSVVRNFREFLEHHCPDVVYVHHYAHMGLELLAEIRASLPNVKLILTLHEYTAICNNQGQMIKTGAARRLCYRSSLEDCHMCFPDISPESFWLRRRYIDRHFDVVDLFVSPSKFLRQRYIDWGIAADRIVVIENGQPSMDGWNKHGSTAKKTQTIGFFGQITEYKGVDLLLRAISLVSREARGRLLVEVHGANLESQTQAFQESICTLRAPLIEEGCLRWVGPYERNEMFQRMLKVDWVVVPSIWWENSPMVIQEAYVCGKPVICADIGGMAEKVVDGFTGLHFEARNPFSLAARLEQIAKRDSNIVNVGTDIEAPVTYYESAQQYKRLAVS